MKVLGFNGSPRNDGNTTELINYLFDEIHKEGIDTEIINLSNIKIRGCIACNKCFENKNKRCVITDDLNKCIEKILNADGVVFASPSYFQDVTTEMKALIDRVGFVGLANDKMYTNKIAGTLACFRRTGSVCTIDTINHFFMSNDFIIIGRAAAMAKDKGDLRKDLEGISLAKNLGKRMAWIIKKLNQKI